MNKRILILLPVLFFAVTSCEDIFETDLAKEKVTVLAPTDNYRTNIMTQNFWWEEVNGAAEYNLQIVSPSFSTVQKFVVDTNVNDNFFTYTLEPGQYQWRIKAVNASSSTSYVTYTLYIDTTSDLSQQTIVLEAPSNGKHSNSLTQTFSWQNLFSADSYTIQISETDFSDPANIVTENTVTGHSFTHTFTNQGVYQWRVKAQNAASSTAFSDIYTLTIDTAAPAAPSLLTPLDNEVITSQPFNYQWSRDAGIQVSSILGDSLYVYSDSLVTLTGDVFFTTSTTVSDSLPMGTYFWRVRTVDNSGNISGFSTARKFTVQ